MSKGLPQAAISGGALEKSLPSSLYVTPESFETDKRTIFHREWFCAAREEDLPSPGDHITVDVAGENILVIRTRSGEIRAHYNVCRHRGARLCDPANDARWGVSLGEDRIGRGLIRCPYHGWTYNDDGALLATPGMQKVAGFDKRDFGLYPVGVGLWGGFVFLNLSPDEAPNFDEALGEVPRRLGNYPLDALETSGPISYDVTANWKLIVENYNECYHCSGVHPELCELVPEFRNAGGSEVDWDAGVAHRTGAVTYTSSGTTNRKPFAGLSENEKARHKGELLYPNVMLSMASDHVAAFVLWPLAHDRTRVECRFLFHPSEIASEDFAPEDATGFWDMVNKQDWAVCERVQAGMSARVHEFGYYSPMEDLSLDIRRYVADRHGR